MNSYAIVDVTLTHDDSDDPQPTFCAAGPHAGMRGKWCTRIDAVLANAVGAAAVKRVTHRWDLALSGHVPIEVELDATVFETTVNAPTLPAPIDVSAIGKLEQGKGQRQVGDAC